MEATKLGLTVNHDVSRSNLNTSVLSIFYPSSWRGDVSMRDRSILTGSRGGMRVRKATRDYL